MQVTGYQPLSGPHCLFLPPLLLTQPLHLTSRSAGVRASGGDCWIGWGHMVVASTLGEFPERTGLGAVGGGSGTASCCVSSSLLCLHPSLPGVSNTHSPGSQWPSQRSCCFRDLRPPADHLRGWLPTALAGARRGR